MKTRIIVACIVVLSLAGLLAFSQWRHEPFQVSGVIEADEVRVGSHVGGRVIQIPDQVYEGATVTKGQLLVKLDEFDLSELRAEAAANVNVKKEQLLALENGFRDEEVLQAKEVVNKLTARLAELENGSLPEEIAAAKARVELAAATVTRAQSSYDRTADLFAKEQGVITREDVDRATEELTVAQKTEQVRKEELKLVEHGTRSERIQAAKAELAEAEASLKLLQNGPRSEDIAAAKAEVQAAEAMLNAIDIRLQETEVRAPVDGVIEAFDLQVGDLVGPGAPMISIVDHSRLRVRAYVPENRLDLKLNQQTAVRVDSFPGEVFKGAVTFIARQGEFTPSNVQTPEERSKQVFRIKVDIQEGLDKLRPGMAADVLLEREA